jgi:hypothetical protein
MKRIATVLSILLFTAAVFAQEPDNKFRTKLFEVHHRTPRDISLAIKTLGSGSKGADLTWNDEMHTITVRDFPENIAAIEEAIGRLDRPTPAAPDVELKISLLIGSKTPLPGPLVPDDLASVVKQLQSTLRYSHYGLLAANIHHTRAGEGIEGSGVAESTLVRMAASDEHPVFYNYRLRNIVIEQGTDRQSVGVQNVSFSLRVPVKLDKGTSYQSVGFETPITIRQGEKVVIGTTTMGDRAVIVVLTATVGGK